MKISCCSGAEAERWLRTLDHVTVRCAVCPTTFCVDRKDAEAEEWYSKNYEEADGSQHRRARSLPQRPWYCSLACLNRRRAGLAGTTATETRDQAQGTFLDEEAS